MKRRILIIEDDPIMRLGMSHFLISQGYDVELAADGKEGMSALEKGRYDLVITDLRLPYHDGIEILARSKELALKAGIVIVTGHAEIKSAVQAIKDGAFDYIAKPFSNDEILVAIERYFKFQKLEDEVVQLRQTLRGRCELENIIGVSPAIMGVLDRVSAVAATDAPVLILGESGTGKEVIANAIHGLSHRSDRPLIKINCAAIPENLFETELFGHEKGTFTGAVETRKGKFEFADRATIFLDEIADIPLNLQPKLLRVLEDQTITRLGGNVSVKVDVRSIYATSRNLRECVGRGEFREDLFYRINIVPITIPSLRERKEDIPYFVDHFVKVFCEKFGKPPLAVTPGAYDSLLAYNYPGNVRELKHIIERTVIFSKEPKIDVKDLPEEVTRTFSSAPCVKDGLSLDDSIRCFERQRIIDALRETGGRKMEAAELLGISRKVLWKKLKDLGIE